MLKCKYYKILILMILLATGNKMIADIPTDGRDLIKMMHDKYKNNFFKSLSFSQHLIRYEHDKVVSREVMHEAYLAPGKLMLKFNGWNSGDGLLFRCDSIYTYKNGEIITKEERIHDLLLLCFDLYNIPPDSTINKLLKLNYNLEKVEKIRFNDTNFYVVGDRDGNCFWIDSELLMVVEMQVKNTNRARSVKLSKFRVFESIPIATRIVFFDSNGAVEMVEEYFNVTPFRTLNEKVFFPSNFLMSKW